MFDKDSFKILNEKIEEIEEKIYIDNYGYNCFERAILEIVTDINLRQRFNYLIRTAVSKIEKDEKFYFEYIDNYRFAIEGNEDSIKKYKELKASGCCGSFDESFEYEGIKYYFGFNHGH